MRSFAKGFNLFEVMVVVVILGLLASFIVPKIAGRPDEARVAKVRADIRTLETALDLYRLDNGMYPTNEQGLKALIEKPNSEPVPQNWREGGYVKVLSKDPWGRPYLYANPGEHGEIDVYCNGAKGEAGGTGINAVIGNWQS